MWENNIPEYRRSSTGITYFYTKPLLAQDVGIGFLCNLGKSVTSGAEYDSHHSAETAKVHRNCKKKRLKLFTRTDVNRDAPFLDLNYPLLMCRVGARRKLLNRTLMLAGALEEHTILWRVMSRVVDQLECGGHESRSAPSLIWLRLTVKPYSEICSRRVAPLTLRTGDVETRESQGVQGER